jgi:hypothetical protein
VNESVPEAAVKVRVPPPMVARPENETLFASAVAQARAPRVASLIDPALPLRTAVPLKVTQV